jgi:hypothetical protein
MTVLVQMAASVKPSWLNIAISHCLIGLQMLSFGFGEVDKQGRMHGSESTGIPIIASVLSFVNPMLMRFYWGDAAWTAIMIMALA